MEENLRIISDSINRIGSKNGYKNLKNNKATGVDKTPADLLKEIVQVIVKKLNILLDKC